MPDPKTEAPPAPVTLESIVAERAPTRTEQQQQAISRLAIDAEALHKTETVPGGKYLQDGVYVDAFGVPLKDQS